MKKSHSKILPSIAICVTIALSACTGQESQSIDSQDSVALAAAPLSDEQSDLSALLITGSNESDTITYWNCDTVQADGTSATNIHVRFWSDGNGFSGTSATTWAQVAPKKVSINYDNGTVRLADINMFTLENESDYFTAVDENQGSVSCTRKGPLRGSINAQIFEDFSPIDTLLDDLTTSANEFWLCDETDSSGSVSQLELQLLSNRDAYLNQTKGRWFVDDRFKAIISTPDNVDALSKIIFDSTKLNFSAQRFGSSLSCAKSL